MHSAVQEYPYKPADVSFVRTLVKAAHWFGDERFRKKAELSMHISSAQECDARMIHIDSSAGN